MQPFAAVDRIDIPGALISPTSFAGLHKQKLPKSPIGLTEGT